MSTILRNLILPLVATAALPAQHLIRSTYGFHIEGRYGETVTVGGDVNQDGVPDYLVGTPGRSVASLASVGHVTIVSGSNGATLLGVLGNVANRRLGTAIAALGDVNGDGVPDFASSSPHDSSNGANAGWVGCYSGQTGALLWQVAGSNPGSWFGQSVVGMPDLDGDGVMDVAVGSPRNTASLPSGRVYFYSGQNGALLRTLTSFTGNDWFGQSMALVGDQNGDQIPDLAIGAPTGAGMVVVHRMGTITTPVIWASVQGYGFGATVADAGDSNDDGRHELLVTRWQSPQLSTALVYLLSGATTQVLRTHAGTSNENYGYSLAGGRDIDADGRPDYVIGAPAANGGAGRVEVRSGRTGGLLWQPTGTGDEGHGQAVALMPDIDNDNLADVLFGVPGTDVSSSTNAGRVEVRGYDLDGQAIWLGTGCNGPFSIGLLQVATAPLHYGGAVNVTAPSLRPSSLGMWLFGFAPLPQPVDLALVGMPGCTLWVAPDVTQPFLASAIGAATLSFPIPNNRALTGLRLRVQAADHDPGANAADFTVTQGYELVVGNN